MGARRFTLQDFKTKGTWRSYGCQPCPPSICTPQEKFVILISVSGWVDPLSCQWKIPVTPSEIEPATFRLVAHYLNQMRHLAHPAGTMPAAVTCCSMFLPSKFFSKTDTIFQHIFDTQLAGTNFAEFRILIFTFTNTYSPVADVQVSLQSYL